jgi:hypothetical protein
LVYNLYARERAEILAGRIVTALELYQKKQDVCERSLQGGPRHKRTVQDLRHVPHELS